MVAEPGTLTALGCFGCFVEHWPVVHYELRVLGVLVVLVTGLEMWLMGVKVDRWGPDRRWHLGRHTAEIGCTGNVEQ